MIEQTALPKLTAAPRLNLIPTTADHFAGLHTIFSDADTMRFMPTLPHKNVEETQKHLEQDMNQTGAQHWTIFLKNSDEPIGLVNRLGGTMIPGMGYIIKRNYWGQGLAAEACREVMAYQFEQECIEKIELWINENNHASQRVAEKLDFKLKGQLLQKYSYEDNHHVMQVFGLWKEEWSGGSHVQTKARINDVDPVLIVKDIDAALKFFTDTLGFDLNFTWGEPINHAGVTWGDWSGAQVLVQLGQAPPDFDLTPYSQLHFSTDAFLDELFDTFKANGAEVVTEPSDHPWGMRDFSIRGPEGSLLRFGTHM